LLRKRNARYTLIGLVVSCLLIVGGISLNWYLGKESQEPTQTGTIKMQHRKVVSYSQLEAPPPIEATPPPEVEPSRTKIVQQRKIAAKKFLPPVVKPDAEVIEPEIIPTQEELKLVNPGKQTVEGDTLGAVDLTEYDEALIQIDIDTTNPIRREEVEQPAPPPKPAPPPPPAPEEEKVFNIVEIPPAYPGGQEALYKFISENIEYPIVARENGIQGSVILKVIIEADGSISDVLVLRGLGGGCDEEAVRVARMMPNWIPGIQNGKKVRVGVAMPIRFKLQQEKN